MIPALFFLFGIVIGSFLNVCIWRIPAGESIITPASHCPRCLAAIQPYDNIPILGWLLLRGKCRNCSLPISPMYPLVELCTGLLFLLTWRTYGLTIPTFKFLFLGCLLIILIVTDLRERLLPDAINWPGFGIALAFATRIPPDGDLNPWIYGPHLPFMLTGVLQSLLGATIGSGLLWVAAAAYKFFRKRDGMGMGDVKMMIMVGAFLGIRGAFLTILFGTLLGSVVGITIVLLFFLFNWKRPLAQRAHRRGLGSLNSLRWTIASGYQFPLGTFLGIAALFVFLALPHFGLFTP